MPTHLGGGLGPAAGPGGFLDAPSRPSLTQRLRRVVFGPPRDLKGGGNWRPERVRALAPFMQLDPDDDELTRTRKVRRHFVEEKYKEIIAGMYEGKDSIKIEAIIKFQDGKTSTIRTVMAVRNV